MTDYIRREALLQTLDDVITRTEGTYPITPDLVYELRGEINATKAIRVLVNRFDAADVVEARHGEWVWNKDGMDWNIGAWMCSVCGRMSPMWWNTDRTSPRHKSGHGYCPNCGAKMDGGADNG